MFDIWFTESFRKYQTRRINLLDTEFAFKHLIETSSFNDFQSIVSKYFLKEMSEFELQSNIKNQDMFSIPNLSIEVSNNIDEFLDMGYLKKKTHNQIRDKEIHQLLRKEKI